MRSTRLRGTVRFVVPGGLDADVPSGGIVYDLRLRTGLTALGWEVEWLPTPGSWPHPTPADLDALAARLARAPAAALVLVDGLVGSAATEVLLAEAERLRLVHLVHLPLDNPCEQALLAASTAITTSAWTRQLADREVRPGGQSAPRGRTRRRQGRRRSPAARAAADCSASARSRPPRATTCCSTPWSSSRHLDWRCTLVGALDRAPDFVDRLRQQACEAGLAGRVVFAGLRRHAEMASAYAAADALVVTSRAETYGMVVTEALARGLPVIAGAVGGVPEALGHDDRGHRPGLLIPPAEPAALSGALGRWLEDPGFRRRLRRSAASRRLTLPTWLETASRVAAALEGAR